MPAVLAIDTSGLVAGAALADEDRIIADFTLNTKLTHSQTLMPMIDEMFKLCGVNPQDIGYIACASGPGSFTGIRIGAAVAKGIAFGLGKKIVPVPTLDALAYNIFRNDKFIVPIMDARRNQVYAAVYRFQGEKLQSIGEQAAVDIEDLLDRLCRLDTGCIFLGDGVSVHREAILRRKFDFSIAPINNRVQRAASVAALSLEYYAKGTAVEPYDFKPIYLRLSQAERELNENV